MRIYPLRLLACLLLAACTAEADKLSSVEDRASYSFGVDIVNNLKTQGVELNTDAFVQGIRDAAAGKDPVLTLEERNQAKLEYQSQLQQRLLAEQQAIGEKNLEAGKAFLKANAKKPGVMTTGSGLQYKVIKQGKGKTPTAYSTVVTHYRGTLIDGTEFDSSYSRNEPTEFPVNGVIAGWTEALQLMNVGSKWKLFIPHELAYGAQGAGGAIGPYQALVFEIELLEIL